MAVEGLRFPSPTQERVMLACPMCFKYTFATFEYLGYNLTAEQADILRERKKLRK